MKKRILLCLIIVFMMMFSFNVYASECNNGINWFDKLVDLILALMQAGIIGFVAHFFVKKTYSDIKNNKSLNKCGIQEVNVSDELYKKQMKKIFCRAITIKACYVTGENLFERYIDDISTALQRPTNQLKNMQILICKPNTDFMNNLENIEKKYGKRKDKDDSLTVSIDKVLEKFKKINSGKIEIKYNNTFYFFPYIIAEYVHSDRIIREVYTNFNMPPCKSKNALSFVATAKYDPITKTYFTYDKKSKEWIEDAFEKNVVADIEHNFEYIWNNSDVATNDEK